MTDRELERKLQSALDHAAPDDFADVLSRCGPGKGNVIDMTNMVSNTNGKKKKPWLRGLIAACLALVLLGGGAAGGMWYQANLAVASIVSLDVNPSIQLRVNQNEKVLDCTALNADAAEVLSEMDGGKDLEGAKLDVAVNAIVGALVRHGYLSDLSSAILISVEDNNTTRAARLQQQLTATVDGILQTSSSQASVYSQNMTVDAGLDAQAQANNISSGKAALVNQVLALNPSLEFEKLARLSVEELRDLIKIGAPAMPIGRDAAAVAAETYAGTLALDSVIAEADPELDEIIPCYEVELKLTGRGEYDYIVDAFTGEVLSGVPNILDASAASPSGNSGQDVQTATNPAPGLTGDEALDAALAHFSGRYPELAGNDILNPKVDFDPEDNHIDVEFWCAGYEFDYTLNYTTGEVLGVETDYRTPAQGTVPSGGTTAPSGTSSDIGMDAAKAAALRHAGIAESQVTWVKAQQDWDDGRLEYELEFICNGTEYDYTILAADGTVLKQETEPVPAAGGTRPSTPAVSDIGMDAAKAAALQHAGAAESAVTWLKAQKDWDDGRAEYELEFIVENAGGAIEYDYTIDAATGNVLSYESEYATVNDMPPGDTASPGTTSDIGSDAALAAALDHAGFSASQVSHLNCEREREHGRIEYEIEFKCNGYEYEYTIDGSTGAVLDHECDRDD